jgi:hypothetical protein
MPDLMVPPTLPPAPDWSPFAPIPPLPPREQVVNPSGQMASVQPGPGRFPGLARPFRSLVWCLHVPFGLVCLVLLFALLAAIPGLNILVLGYLLEPQKRVAESGRLRDGFPMLVLAPRLGVIGLIALLVLGGIRLLATRVADATVILGVGHPEVARLQTALTVSMTAGVLFLLTTVVVVGLCGYRIWRPLTRAGRQDMLSCFEQIPQIVRPVHHFWIGLKAFFGAILWLAIPTGMLVAYSAPGRTNPVFGLISFLGVMLLIPVAAWLPLLQVHQVLTGRFRAIFSVGTVRRIISRAPVSWMLTTIVLYVMTLPLYLAKVKLLPADALLVITPIFIVLTYPARILVAWAYHRGARAQTKAWFPLRWGIKLLMIPLLGIYAGFVFLTPFVSELGKAAPLENQAFLSPVPYAQWGRNR